MDGVTDVLVSTDRPNVKQEGHKTKFSTQPLRTAASLFLTLALASLAASASAAIARCSWTGSRTSLLQRGEELIMQPVVRSLARQGWAKVPLVWNKVPFEV